MKKLIAIVATLVLLCSSGVPIYAAAIPYTQTANWQNVLFDAQSEDVSIDTNDMEDDSSVVEEENVPEESESSTASNVGEENPVEVDENTESSSVAADDAADDTTPVEPSAVPAYTEETNLVTNGSFETPHANGSAPYADGWSWWNPEGKTSWSGKNDNTASQEGERSLYFKGTKNDVRLSFSQKVKGVDTTKAYMAVAWIKTNEIAPNEAKAGGVLFRAQYQNSSNNNVGPDGYIPMAPVITDTQGEWQRYTIYLPNIPAAATQISVEFYLQYCTGEVWFDNVQLYETYKLHIDGMPEAINKGESAQLSLQATPAGADLGQIHWSSSDSTVASVSETGVVTGESIGEATITAASGDYSVAADVMVQSKSASTQYKAIRDKWADRLTGNSCADKTDADYVRLMAGYTQNAQTYYDSMLKTGNRTTLWDDLDLKVNYPGSGKSDATLSVDFLTAYERLGDMALAYAANGSSLYHNTELKDAILDGIKWMYTNVYNENYPVSTKLYGNWWHWQIGIPQQLANIAILMYEDLSTEEINSIYLTLQNFNETPTKVWNVFGNQMVMTSANLMDTSLVAVLKETIGEKGTGIADAKAALPGVLTYTTSGDGFYVDGSCIQHTNLAYTGGYGATLLRGIDKQNFLLAGTDWAIDPAQLIIVYDWIVNGYFPLMVQGAMMDMVSGRGIARPTSSDMMTARGILQPVLSIANTAPEPQRTEMLSFAKQMLNDGMGYFGDEFYKGMSAGDVINIKRLLADAAIVPGGQGSYHKVFGAMDKVVVHNANYSMGISMYSSRTGSFEFGNGENLKGWHTSDGALYLYMGDQNQYADAYWPTVDSHRLTGITTDHTEGTISNSWNAHTSNRTWVGGSYLGAYGSTGMDFQAENSTLAAKKSWFTFGDAIVALGADITSSNGKSSETIVDNRKINMDGSNGLIVNGTVYSAKGQTTVPSAQWAWLEGNTDSGSDAMGYYFPDSTGVTVLREERTGSWKEINSNASADTIVRNYASLAIPHGVNPQGSTYSYVMLPGYTADKTQAYMQNPEIVILENTGTVQAVKHNASNTTGINFWQPELFGFVNAKTPLSMTMQENGNMVQLGVSDPTQVNGSTVFVLRTYDWTVATADEGITYEQTEYGLKITVPSSGTFGKTFNIMLSRADRTEEYPEEPSEPIEMKNLVKNGGFEQTEPVKAAENANMDWSLWQDNVKAVEWNFQRYPADASVDNYEGSLDTTSKTEGNQSFKMDVKNAPSNQQAIFKQGSITAEGNTTYNLSFMLKYANVNKDFEVRLEEYDSTSAMLQRTVYKIPAGSLASWTEKAYTMTTRPSTVRMLIAFVFPSGTKGTMWLDDVKIVQDYTPVQAVELNKSTITLAKGMTETLVATIAPNNASNKQIVWSSSDTSVATVSSAGVITPKSVGTAVITAKSKENSSAKASCVVNVEESIFVIDGGDRTLMLAEKRYLDYVDSEAVAGDKLAWSSSDESVAVIGENGLLETRGTGVATITLKEQGTERNASIQLTVIPNTDGPEYIKMRERWANRVLGPDSIDTEDRYIASYIQNISNEADILWNSMNKGEERTDLWDLPYESDARMRSAQYTTRLNNLKKLLLAYGIEGTTLYQQREVYEEIVGGLAFMYEVLQYDGEHAFGNWWDWQIGGTHPFVDILIVLYDYMEPAERDKYVTAIDKYAGDPSRQMSGTSYPYATINATGANRTDIGIAVLGNAILAQSDSKMDLIKSKVPDAFKIVTSGDGLYADGSLIQHAKFAYTGAYGNELLKGAGRIMSVVADTPWEFANEQLTSLYQTVEKGFLPLIYNGKMMAMVNGRSISRAASGGIELRAGAGTIANIMVLAEFAPAEYSAKFKSAAKYWMQQAGSYYDYYGNARDIEAVINYVNLMKDTSVVAQNPFEGIHVYGSMDKVVQSTPTYGVGFSMYSTRTYNFEYGNKENARGWYTGSGAVYIYNSDLAQFGEAYWPTVDAYRIPGTTVDTRALSDGQGSSKTMPNTWVGAASDGQIGSIGMHYDASNLGVSGMNITAKKSWYAWDGALVSLGADINGTTNASIETIVDNRILNADGSNKILVNGQVFDGNAQNIDLPAGSWVHMEGADAGSDMGYYFPEATTLHIEKEFRTGKYSDINGNVMSSDTVYEAYYLKMYISHGKAPVKETYYYVTLPGMTAEQTKNFAQANELQMLQNDGDVQAFRNGERNMVMANVWNSSGAEVEGFGINTSAAFTARWNGNELTVSVTNTQRNGAPITVSLPGEILEVVSKHEAITVAEDGKSFTASTTNGAGASRVIVLKMKTPVTGINMQDKAAAMTQGEQKQLSVSLLPSYATEKPAIEWSSSDNTIAQVDENGRVIAIKEGKAIITAKAGQWRATCEVTVIAKETPPTPPTSSSTDVPPVTSVPPVPPVPTAPADTAETSSSTEKGKTSQGGKTDSSSKEPSNSSRAPSSSSATSDSEANKVSSPNSFVENTTGESSGAGKWIAFGVATVVVAAAVVLSIIWIRQKKR